MKKNTSCNLISLLAAALLVLLDQWTKHLAILHLKGQAPFVIWEGVFELNYLENRGMAFGMLQGQRLLFLIGTLAVLVLVAVCCVRMPESRRFFPARLVGVLLTAGAIGNLIDRVSNAYVVDFLYFKLIDFPVFNVADCYVTVGAVLLALLFLFYYREEELNQILPGKRQKD